MKLLYTGDKETSQDITSAHYMKIDGGGIVITDISGIKKWLVRVEFEGLENTSTHALTLQPVLYRIAEKVWFSSVSQTLPICDDEGLGIAFFEVYLDNSAFDAENNDLRFSILSGNGGDNSVDIQCRIYDLDLADSDNYVAADIKELGASAAALVNLLAMFDGTGYVGGTTKLDVNVDTVNGGTPIVLADITTIVEAAAAAVKLAADGLSVVSKTEPSGDPSTWTYQDWQNWLWRRFANKTTLTLPPGGEGTLKVRNDADNDDLSSQDVDETGTNQLILGEVE